ncbi:hypothetical protein ACQ4PT_057081 [Festuca glaucescens]
MEKVMKITDVLCQTLQRKSIDILNALDSVSNTKVLLGKLREDGWESLLVEVQSFCLKHEIEVPDLDRKYVDVTRSCNKHDNTTTFHHYKADVFNVAIDQQLAEINDRFGKAATYSMVDRLLRLVITLPVSTTTTERAFSAMKLIKTRLRNRMGDDFLRHYMIVYIGKEIAAKITSDDIIDLFGTGSRRAEFKLIDR